jgi:hypothetical protein
MWAKEIDELFRLIPSLESFTASELGYVLKLLSPSQQPDYFDLIKLMPPVAQQSKYLEITVKLPLLGSRYDSLKDNSGMIAAVLCGYSSIAEYEANTLAPYLFPFTNKTHLLDQAEAFTGMKSLSQIVTGYNYVGLTQLAGGDRSDIEKVIYSELSNFPLDGLSVSIVRAADEDFCNNLPEDVVCHICSLDNLLPRSSSVSIQTSVIILDIDSVELTNAMYQSFKTNAGISSYILSPSVSDHFQPLIDGDEAPYTSSVLVCLENITNKSRSFHEKAEYSILFKGAPDSLLAHCGFADVEDFSVVVDVEEDDNVRFFVAKINAEPQLQIYPW